MPNIGKYGDIFDNCGKKVQKETDACNDFGYKLQALQRTIARLGGTK